MTDPSPPPMTTEELTDAILNTRKSLVCQDCGTEPHRDNGAPVRVACNCTSVYPTGSNPGNPDAWKLTTVNA